MGIDPRTIPPQMRRMMPAEHPESAAAQERRHAANEAKLESEMHDEFATWLTHHARPVPVPFVHSRMDRASTIRVGTADFWVAWDGGMVAIEFKLTGNKLTDSQLVCMGELYAADVPLIVANSTTEAIEFVKRHLFGGTQ